MGINISIFPSGMQFHAKHYTSRSLKICLLREQLTGEVADHVEYSKTDKLLIRLE